MSALPRLRQPVRAARAIARSFVNLRDRLFDASALVQSGQTPYEVIHEDGIWPAVGAWLAARSQAR